MGKKKKPASENVEQPTTKPTTQAVSQSVKDFRELQNVVSGLCVKAYGVPVEIRDRLSEGLKVFEYYTWDYLYKLYTSKCQYHDNNMHKWLKSKFKYLITRVLGLKIVHEYNTKELSTIAVVVVENGNKYYNVKLVYDNSEKYCVKIEFSPATIEELLESGIYPWRPEKPRKTVRVLTE